MPPDCPAIENRGNDHDRYHYGNGTIILDGSTDYLKRRDAKRWRAGAVVSQWLHPALTGMGQVNKREKDHGYLFDRQ